MAVANVNNIQIAYEAFGDSKNPAILLIAGIACHLIVWDKALCEKLANAGFYVVRFDNRDVGLSTHYESMGTPNIPEAINLLVGGKSITPPYTYSDMANDSVALLQYLHIKKAHVVGMSLGAGIAQTIAIEHSECILSLISIYGSTGNPKLPSPSKDVSRLLTSGLPETNEAVAEHLFNTYKLFSKSQFTFDDLWHKNLAEESSTRGFAKGVMERQFLAGLGVNRRKDLEKIKTPTLVIHGNEDKVIAREGGVDTANAIKDSIFIEITGMAHDLPKLDGAWDQVSDEIISFLIP